MPDTVNSKMADDILKVLISEEEIKSKVREIGQQISKDFAGKTPLIVSVLKGSFVFMADLVRAIDINCTIDFMSVSSYGTGTRTSGEVKIIKDLDIKIEGRDLIVVEDILDSGVTLSYLLEVLKARGPKSLTLCTLLDKPTRRKREVNITYRGYEVPDEFVVGYGLDYAEKYRNLPYLGILKPEIYGE